MNNYFKKKSFKVKPSYINITMPSNTKKTATPPSTPPASKKASPAKKVSPAKKASSAKKVAAAAAPAVAAAPAATPVVAAPAATPAASTPTTYSDIESQFAAITTRLSELRTLESSILSDVRKLQKNTAKYIKDINRKTKRKRATTAEGDQKKRAPSGFAKPALISPELCSFLGKPTGTEMARTEVTKFLTTYIKENALQDPSNRRKILPDKKLQTLLNTKKSDEVTYFNLQKYMKVHFPASVKAAADKAAAAVAATVSA
jgi:chromatin remodeling complex protein RSC6